MPNGYTITKQYDCIAGDNWGGIAWKIYGDEMQLHHLIAANPLYSDVLTFDGGEILNVPELSSAVKDNLPDWEK